MQTSGNESADVADVAFSPGAFMDALHDSDLTPQEFAIELGAAPVTIAKWLAGLSAPRPAMLKQAARILRVKPEDLLEQETTRQER